MHWFERFRLLFFSFLFVQLTHFLFLLFERSIGDDWRAAFSGLTTNPMFVTIIIISVVVQIIFVEAFGAFTKTAGITIGHWLISIALGSVSLVLGIAMRYIEVKEDPNTFKGYTFEKPVVEDEGETK